ncbi:hypothetical protein [Neptunomonas sp.]|uniref:hypothetical protein n=1 Tax=Neptunomonas sp. TaxID=1971898 RepID=UPI003564E1EC
MKVVLTIADTQRWVVLAERIEGHKTTNFDSISQESRTSDVDNASHVDSAYQMNSTSDEGTVVLTDVCTNEQITEKIKSNAINTVVVFYQQAEHYLAEAVRQGVSFEKAAEEWLRTTNELLQTQRKNRACLKLINIEQALAAPTALCEQLTALYMTATCEVVDSLEQDVTLLAACQYVAQVQKLSRLNLLIQTSSLLLSADNKVEVNVESIIGTNQEPLVAQLNESTAENSLLLMQLQQVQEEIEENSIEKTTNNAEQVAQQQLTSKLKGIEAENLLLLTQLHHVQEELERVFLSKDSGDEQKKLKQKVIKLEHKLRNIKADLASKNYRLGLIVQEIADMKRSVFWKTGTPIRAVTQVFNKSKIQRKKVENDIELILSSEFFDAEWYLSEYPDVAESTISPAEHYLRFGAAEQRFPGPLFSGAWYTETYPDVAESGINPLLHYIKFGRAEGRTASVKLLQDQFKAGD